MRATCRSIAEAPWFSRVIVGVLVINAIAIGLRTAASVSRSLDPLLVAIEVAVVVIFVVEMAIKITGFGPGFFGEAWNWFDLPGSGVSAVSPCTIVTLVRGTSSSSAAIWVSAVRTPVPRSTLPE